MAKPEGEDAGPAQAHLAVLPEVSLKQQQQALRDGRMLGFHCIDCGHEQISPMLGCPKCRGRSISTREFSTTGTVVSHTIQSVASEAFMNETPFAFAVIRLDDGPRVSGWIPWVAKPRDLPPGSRVEYTPSYKPGMMFEKR